MEAPSVSPLDVAHDVLEDTINNVREANAPPDPVEAAKQDGQAAGAAAATHDLSVGVFDGREPASIPTSFEDASRFEQAHTEVHLPGVENPWLTGIEVALTPSEVNVGEKTYFDAQAAYADSYHNGYQAALTQDFDRRLEERFEFPHHSSDPPPAPSPLDSAIPPLDVDPGPSIFSSPIVDHSPSYDSGSSGHSGSDSGYSGGSDGGSSGGSDSGSSGGSDSGSSGSSE
jgi:uncharacterized membrane protein YgcG